MRRRIHLWKPLGAIRPPSNLRQNAWTQVLVASGVRSDEASEQPRSSAALLLIVAARLCWTRRSAEAHCEFRWRSWTGPLQHRQRWANRCHYLLLLVAHCALCQQKFPHSTARSNNSAYCSPRFLHQAATIPEATAPQYVFVLATVCMAPFRTTNWSTTNPLMPLSRSILKL